MYPELVEQVELCVHEELRGRNERRQRQVEDLRHETQTQYCDKTIATVPRYKLDTEISHRQLANPGVVTLQKRLPQRRRQVVELRAVMNLVRSPYAVDF